MELKFTQANAANFEDIETGFAYKTSSDLRGARLLFSIMSNRWIVKAGAALVPLALKWRLPVRGLIRHTIFKQFVGGESLPQTEAVLSKLSQYGVKAILDYGAEGKESEESFDHTCKEFIALIDYAAQRPEVPFISIKITGLARFALLEKLNSCVLRGESALAIIPDNLSEGEREEWSRVLARVDNICSNGAAKNVGVLVDAEESWIQDTIDALTEAMMRKYNRGKAVVFNTIQFYRTGRLEFLRLSALDADKDGYILGVKIVRGAYMEKERERAARLQYPSPIQPHKQSADRDFNSGMEFCIRNISSISLVIASHNEQSNMLATGLLSSYNLPQDHPHIHFSQLYGMSDNISFNLAKAGYTVSKYLPYGPLDDVIPYLMRRAQENTSVGGQTSRELQLIEREISRRKSSR